MYIVLALHENIQGILDIEDQPFVVSEVSANYQCRYMVLVQVTIEENDVVTMEELDPDPTPPVIIPFLFCVMSVIQAKPLEFRETLTLTHSEVFPFYVIYIRVCTGCMENYGSQ